MAENEGAASYLKLGYGSFASPLASLSWSDRKDRLFYATNFDHYSAKGQLQDQQVSFTSLSGSLKDKFNENQSIQYDIGFERQSYRLFGFDHNLFSLTDPAELRQDFNVFHLATTYQQVAGNEGQTSFSPHIAFDYLIASRKTNEFSIGFQLPFSLSLSESLLLKSQLELSASFLEDTVFGRRNNMLLNLPVSIEGKKEKWQWRGGFNALYGNEKLTLLPDLNILYALNDKGLRLKAGIRNETGLNSLKRLFRINPYLIAPDSLSVYRRSDFFVGIDWLNPKGLQFNLSVGATEFSGLPLFINTGFTERQFKMLSENKLSALHLIAGLEYVFDERLKIKTELQSLHFTRQQRYQEPFGLLPFELTSSFSWKPIPPLTLRMNAYFWRGGMALPVSNGNTGGGFPAFRVNDGADLGGGVDYKLNKKWALWLDLNNIANVRYQRWNRYEAFGFNFIGGFRYLFNEPGK